MNYGTQQAVCPLCGSSAEVRTVAELFDMLNGMQDQAMQQAQQGPQGQFPGPGGPGGPPGQGGQGYSFAGTGYSDSGPSGQGYSGGPSFRNRSSYGDSPFEFTGDIGDDLKNAAIGGAAKFLARGIGKKVQKAVQERVVPAMQARAAQAQQQWQQSRNDQADIVQRYPDLRGCLHDQVVFLEGGTKTVPIREIPMPVTLANADILVNRLRA